MKKLIFVIALIVILPVLVVLDTPPADSASADNETTAGQTEASNSSASEDIYGLRIDNINKSGADFHWSTSIAANGSIEYAYTKLAQQYNPQSSGSQQSVLITVVPLRVKSQPGYFTDHDIRVDDLDMYYDLFVQYTIKSETFSGEVYTLSGELVLVDTQALGWWQTWWFPVIVAGSMWFLGRITKDWNIRKLGSRIKKSKKA